MCQSRHHLLHRLLVPRLPARPCPSRYRAPHRSSTPAWAHLRRPTWEHRRLHGRPPPRSLQSPSRKSRLGGQWAARRLLGARPARDAVVRRARRGRRAMSAQRLPCLLHREALTVRHHGRRVYRLFSSSRCCRVRCMPRVYRKTALLCRFTRCFSWATYLCGARSFRWTHTAALAMVQSCVWTRLRRSVFCRRSLVHSCGRRRRRRRARRAFRVRPVRPPWRPVWLPRCRLDRRPLLHAPSHRPTAGLR